VAPQVQAVTDKEIHLAHQELEHPTTVRVLKAYPPEKASFRPHATSMTAMVLRFSTFTNTRPAPVQPGIETSQTCLLAYAT